MDDTNEFNEVTSTECDTSAAETEPAPVCSPIYEEKVQTATEGTAQNDSTFSAPVSQQKKKNGNGLWITVTAMLVVISIVMTSVAVVSTSGVRFTGFDIPISSTPEYSEYRTVAASDTLDVNAIFEKVAPSVVDILVSSSSGSGFATGMIYSTDGYILTNAHVVENMTSVSVRTYPDMNVYDAEIIGLDSYTDIAVIKIDAKDLIPVEFGESSKLTVGTPVVAIGTPYSLDLTHTTTEGIVSGLRENYDLSSLGMSINVIQHSAAINSGNSGGPLINMYGQVIGINSVKVMNNDNIGFAIPIEDALPLVEQIMLYGEVRRPVLGITASTYAAGGVYVASVSEGSGAEAAGIQPGDIIIEVDDWKVTTIYALISRLGSYQPGQKLVVKLIRDNVEMMTEVTLGEKTEEQ